MARHRSFYSAYTQIQREAARSQAAQVRAQAAAQTRGRAFLCRLHTGSSGRKKGNSSASTSRAVWHEVAAMNADLEAHGGSAARTPGRLAAGWHPSELLGAEDARGETTVETCKSQSGRTCAEARRVHACATPTGMGKLSARPNTNRRSPTGKPDYELAVKGHRSREAKRTSALAKAHADWKAAAAQLEEDAKKQHLQVDAFAADYLCGDLDAVVSYWAMVLEASAYPDSFPHRIQVRLRSRIPAGRRERYELPTVENRAPPSRRIGT